VREHGQGEFVLSAMQETFKRSDSVVSRSIAGEVILVPIRHDIGDLEHIYTFNETASQVWEWLDGQRTVQALCDLLVKEFSVGSDEAEQDLIDLLQQLEAIGAVERV